MKIVADLRDDKRAISTKYQLHQNRNNCVAVAWTKEYVGPLDAKIFGQDTNHPKRLEWPGIDERSLGQ